MILDLLAASYGEPDPQLDDMDLETLAQIEGELRLVAQTVRTLQGLVHGQMADKIGEGNEIQVGETVWRYKPEWTPRIVDLDSLADWLGDDWREVIPYSAGTRVKITGIKGLASKRGQEAAVDTFVEWVKGPAKVKPIPVERIKT